MSPLFLPCSNPLPAPPGLEHGQGTGHSRGALDQCRAPEPVPGVGVGCPAHVLTLSHGDLLQSRGDPSAGTYLTLVLFLKMPS